MAKKSTKTRIPFDKLRALAGEPVVTRTGCKVTKLYDFGLKDAHPIYGVIRGSLQQWTNQGLFFEERMENENDLFMAPVLVTKYIGIFKAASGQIYPGGCFYDDEAKVRETFKHTFGFIDAVQVTFEVKQRA